MNKKLIIVLTALLTINLQHCAESKKWWEEIVACCGLEECFPFTNTPSLPDTELYPLIQALANIESTDPVVSRLANLAKPYQNFNNNAAPGGSASADSLLPIINAIRELSPSQLLYVQLYLGATYSRVTFPPGTIAAATFNLLQTIAFNHQQPLTITSQNAETAAFFDALIKTTFNNINASAKGTAYPPAAFTVENLPTDPTIIKAIGTALSISYVQQ